MLIDYPLFAAPLSHIFLTVYNVLIYLLGIVFLVVGCFINSQRYLLYDLYVDSFALSLMVLLMIGITAGVLLIDVSFYRGSLVEGSCQIIGLSVIMLLICTFELSAFLSGTLLRVQIEARTRVDLQRQLTLYDVTAIHNSTVNWLDYLQPEIGCCGVDSANEWAAKMSTFGQKFPDSCCQTQWRHQGCGTNMSLIYERSCMDVFHEWMNRDVLKFSIGCMILCVLQIAGIVGLCLVSDQVESRWSRNQQQKKQPTPASTTEKQ